MFELPPFYLQQQERRLCVSSSSSSPCYSSTESSQPMNTHDDMHVAAGITTTTTTTTESSSSSSSLLLTMLPSELLHLSLLSYGNYGTIAKLACVRSEWKNMLRDSVRCNMRYQYQLAQAMIHGTDGLLKNQSRGIHILQQMTYIPIDTITHMPIFTIPSATNNTDNSQNQATAVTTPTPINNTDIPKCNHNDCDKTATCRSLPRRDITTTSTYSRSDRWTEYYNDEDDHFYIRKAMKALAYLYLDDDDDDDDDIDEDNCNSNNNNNSNSNSNIIQEKQIGMQWLLCAYHIGQDIDAAYELATIYEYGTYANNNDDNDTTNNESIDDNTSGISMDLEKAIYYLQQGAKRGHTESMVELALHYEMGCHDILPVHIELAYYWYHQAAQRGHIIAKYSIGDAYERGIISSSTITTSLSSLSSSFTATTESSSEPLNQDDNNTNVNMTLACLYYYQAAIEGDDEDSITALRRLYDIARIVIPGISTKLQLHDKKERILTNE